MARLVLIIIPCIFVVALLVIGGLFVLKLSSAPTKDGLRAAIVLDNRDDTTAKELRATVANRSRANLLAEFDLTDLRVDKEELIQGTDKKDQIVAIVDPDHSSIDSIDELSESDRMIAVTIEGETVGYPLTILTFREIINDRIADTPIAVTY